MTVVGACGLNPTKVESLWNSVALTTDESVVLSAVRLIDPTIEKLNLRNIDDLSTKRVPFAKAKDQDRPVPLASFGDGTNRLFGIALALVNAKNGMCLIDEFENGLHYSVQPTVWKLVFRLASELNVQVFATTHSYDCIRAFEEAAKESPEEGRLIGLVQMKDRLFVGEYDENELGIAVEGQIEVRG